MSYATPLDPINDPERRVELARPQHPHERWVTESFRSINRALKLAVENVKRREPAQYGGL